VQRGGHGRRGLSERSSPFAGRRTVNPAAPEWTPLLILFVGLAGTLLGVCGLVGRRPAGQPWCWAALAFAGILAVGGVAAYPLLGARGRDSHREPTSNPEENARLGLPTEVQGVRAVTDRGRPIPVSAVRRSDGDTAWAPDDARMMRERNAWLIPTAAPDLGYNCHGWVFAAGKHWVLSRDVDAILEDNGYGEVSDPQPGDVVIYRHPNSGQVWHSGVLRVAEGGLMLVESKWGPLGRYLHRPEGQFFGNHFNYYRSPRQGHTLRGLGE
jgi:hypothetical protein